MAAAVVAAAILFFFGLHTPPVAHADTDTVTVLPAVINGSGVPNDILNYSLTITNTSNVQENIFATVCELTASGTQVFANPSQDDRATLLAAWIGVSRGAILLQPGQSTTTPVEIQISPYAAAGDYHAVIAFVEGGTRDDAEQHLNGAPQTLIDMSVASGLTASLRIDAFSSVKSFYTGFPVVFTYIIENNGQVSSTPSGQMTFYDRSGHELGSIDANPENIPLAPGAKQSFTAPWQGQEGLGQYRAVLDLSYGGENSDLQDTALVWVLPWKKILVLFTTLFILTIAFAIWLHHEYEKRHHRRRRAIENLLKRKNFETTIDLRHPHE